MQETTMDLDLNYFIHFPTWKVSSFSVQLIKQTAPMLVLLTDYKNKGFELGLSWFHKYTGLINPA